MPHVKKTLLLKVTETKHWNLSCLYHICVSKISQIPSQLTFCDIADMFLWGGEYDKKIQAWGQKQLD